MKYKFEQLVNRSYKAIRKRGLITSETDFDDFIPKMHEELKEITDAYFVDGHFNDVVRETVDLMAVCINALVHHGVDPIAEFEKCVIHQETRKD